MDKLCVKCGKPVTGNFCSNCGTQFFETPFEKGIKEFHGAKIPVEEFLATYTKDGVIDRFGMMKYLNETTGAEISECRDFVNELIKQDGHEFNVVTVKTDSPAKVPLSERTWFNYVMVFFSLGLAIYLFIKNPRIGKAARIGGLIFCAFIVFILSDVWMSQPDGVLVVVWTQHFLPLILYLFCTHVSMNKWLKVLVCIVSVIGSVLVLAPKQSTEVNSPSNVQTNNSSDVSSTTQAKEKAVANESIATPAVEQKKPIPTKQYTPETHPKIPASMLKPMKKEHNPKLYKEWGADWFKKLNKMLPQAALIAAESDRCDQVIWVDVSGQRSTPRQNAVFFVDCKNGERFYVSQGDIEQKRAVSSVKESTSKYSDGDYIEACGLAAKKQATHPSTFSFSRVMDASVYRTDNGRVVAQVGCEAKNSFNLTVKMQAKCIFDERGLIDLELREKGQ